MEIQLNKDAKIAKKQQAWAKFAEVIHSTELNLQAQASKAQNELILAQSRDDIIDAERSIKEAKSKANEIHQKRLKVTNKIGEITSRMMQPEKDLTEAIKEAEKPLIEIKKEIEKEKAEKIKEIEATQKFMSDCQIQVNEANERSEQLIIKTVGEAYKGALEADTKPEEVDDYIDYVVRERLEGLKPKVKRPQSSIPEEKKKEIINNVKEDILSLDEIESKLRDQLKEAFADYEVAQLNKEQAQKRAEQKEKEESEKAKQRAEASKAASEIASKASVNVGDSPSEGSKLKKSFEIDMDENVDNAIAIMAAFVANSDKCMPKLRVNKWFSFTPRQAGKALAKVKSDDNNFDPKGIIFKEVSKL